MATKIELPVGVNPATCFLTQREITDFSETQYEGQTYYKLTVLLPENKKNPAAQLRVPQETGKALRERFFKMGGEGRYWLVCEPKFAKMEIAGITVVDILPIAQGQS